MYKEVRSTSLNGAVAQLTSEMVGRHKAQRESLVIVRTTELKGDLEHEAKRRQIRQVAKYDMILNSHYSIKELDLHQLSEKYSDPQGLFFLLK